MRTGVFWKGTPLRMQLRRAFESVPPGLASLWNQGLSSRLVVAKRAQDAVPLLILASALGLGLGVRLFHLLHEDFPLMDGGMFYVMVRDLQASGYALPAETTYNSASIPFAYPPLGFYVAAILDDLTGLTLIQVFRFLPLVLNLATIGAVFLLARSLLRSWLLVAIAVIVFALLPRSYEWLIMGGGMARAPGLLFMVLAVQQAYVMYETGQKRYALSTGVLCALTVLSHAEAAWVLFFTVAILWLCYGLRPAGIVNSVLAVATTLVVIAPWAIAVVAEHGVEPFRNASQTGGDTWDSWPWLLDWRFVAPRYLNWPAGLALVGGLFAVARGQFFLPVWLAAIVILDPRSAHTFGIVPLSLLIGVGLGGLIEPLWNGRWANLQPEAERPARSSFWAAKLSSLAPKLAVVAFVSYIAVLGMLWTFADNSAVVLRGLDAGERSAMSWVETNAGPGSSFAVVTNAPHPWMDAESEWFYALTGHPSLATVQGYEWFGEEEAGAQFVRAGWLQSCSWQGVECLEHWRANNMPYTHVYMAKGCCPSLDASLRQSAGYELVADLEAAEIFRRR
jgi:hypothetical protein